MSLVHLDAEEGRQISEAPPLEMMSAEISQQIATAKRYPRSLTHFRKSLIANATLTEAIAQSCTYALPRAGKKIEGPSIRLAEMALATYGNCRAGARVVAELDHFVVAQGVFIDLESNAAVTMEVSRRIVDNKGVRFGVDMIGVTANAACSIAMRNAIFRGIPKALWWDAYLMACRTVVGDVKTLADKRKSAIEALKPYNVTEAQIYAALGVGGMMDVGPEQLVTLAGYLTAIQQEEADPEDLFPPAETKGKQAGGARQAPALPSDKTPAPKSAATSEGAGAKDARQPGGSSTTAAPASSADETPEPTALEVSIAGMIGEARNAADLDALPQMYAEEIAKAPPDVQARIGAMIEAARRGEKPATPSPFEALKTECLAIAQMVGSRRQRAAYTAFTAKLTDDVMAQMTDAERAELDRVNDNVGKEIGA